MNSNPECLIPEPRTVTACVPWLENSEAGKSYKKGRGVMYNVYHKNSRLNLLIDISKHRISASYYPDDCHILIFLTAEVKFNRIFSAGRNTHSSWSEKALEESRLTKAYKKAKGVSTQTVFHC